MIERMLATTVLVLMAPHTVAAAPEDYRDRIPRGIHDMELVDWTMMEDELVAYYGETIGRATLRIFPAPAADPGGEHEEEPATSGETPAAQRALLELLTRNLTEGTGALGEGYATNAIRLFTVRLDGSDALGGGALACGFIERAQAEDRVEEGEERMVLSDRICLTQHEDDILAVSITTPHRPNSMRQDMNEAQITFSGLLIGALLRSGEEDGDD